MERNLARLASNMPVLKLCSLILAISLFSPALTTPSQDRPGVPLESSPGTGLRRSRLYLKDGSYQVVLSYRVQGKNVVYRSAERAGEEEAIPLKLVDLDATHLWEQKRDATASGKPVIDLDPALAREEADRAARSPEIATNLRLPEDDSVVALDVFQGQSQLAILQQTDGNLNRQTAHNVLRTSVNPLSTAHQLVEIKGERAPVQLHVPDPVLYVRLDDDAPANDEVPPGALQIDTHGAKGVAHEKASTKSTYVIVRVDVRRGIRVVTSFSINLLGSAKRQGDVIETTTTPVQGGHWLKITPRESMIFGEYALVEVLDDRNINLGMWDFGVHPTAGANRDAIVPQERKAPSLERRRTQPGPE